jgi:copper chaperone
MKYYLEVENIKCGGCANSITKKIESISGVTEVEIDVEKGGVGFTCEESLFETIKETLHSIGYPVVGSVEGFDKIKTKAKSFASCAIGKMS